MSADGPGDGREEPDDQPDHEHLPDPVQADPPLVVGIGWVHDALYYGIALLLVAVAAAVLVHTAADGVASGEPFFSRATAALNGVLFVVIVLELLRTVLAHFQDPTLHLKPFLIIGIISVVRHVLTVGGELSLEENKPAGALFTRSDVELGINALVVLVLVLGLVLIRRTEETEVQGAK